jgi:hypothetical protein
MNVTFEGNTSTGKDEWLTPPELVKELGEFDLDHLIFHAKRSVINKAARKSLTEIGDACWHCHIGAGTFVIQTALSWKLDLMIWGESIA